MPLSVVYKASHSLTDQQAIMSELAKIAELKVRQATTLPTESEMGTEG